MGLFGGGKKPKDSNYLSFQSLLNKPYAVTKIKEAIYQDTGVRREVQGPDLFKYLGRSVHLVEIQFNGATLRLTNDPLGDVVYEGKRFIQDHQLDQLEDQEETSELSQKGVTIKLKGYSNTIVDILNQKRYERAKVTCWAAFMDDHSNNEPLVAFVMSQGYVDQPTIKYDAVKGKAELKLTTTSMLSRLQYVPGARTANAVQQAKYPGDNFFKFSSSTQSHMNQLWKMK
ncbi:hypothetical protein [Aeromonas salmonicida]|uniref:hypothetical protein n=1 Tax=Aeromonas salmonicida TaxID=645 RepID=UPI003D1A8528